MSIREIRENAILDTVQRFGTHGTMTRRRFIEDGAESGAWVVIHVEGSKYPRRLANWGQESLGFFTPRDVTETAFRYAERLAAERKLEPGESDPRD